MPRSLRFLLGIALLSMFALGLEIFLQVHRVAHGPEPAKRIVAAMNRFEFLGSGGVVMQQGAFDCGPAALKMVLDYYRIPASLESLEREMLDSPRGTTMARMSLVARQRGLLAEGRRVDEQEFSKLKLPSIALFERRHYVVVAERTPDGYLTILDPSLGKCRAREDTFLRSCHGEILVISKTS